MTGGALVLGMDIGGTNLRCGLADEAGGLHCFEAADSRELLLRDDPMAALAGFIRGYCGRNLGGGRPAAISIGFPATVDRTRRVVLSAPNLATLRDIPAAGRLERELDAPVYINKDVNFLLLHDMRALGLEELPVVAGVYFGTGIGGAVSVGGRILAGKNGAAFEIGHIPVRGSDRLCGCGNTGCAETVASGTRLEQLRAHHFPSTPIGALFEEHGNGTPLRAFVDDMAVVAATAVNLFDPDCLVVGGGVVQMAGFPRGLFEERLRLRARGPVPREGLRAAYASAGQRGGVAGACIYGFRRLEDEEYL